MRLILNDKLITDALRYMKVPPSSHTPELVRTVTDAFEKLEGFITLRCVWGRFHIARFDDYIEIEGAIIHSKDIARLTARSDECFLLAATLGHEVDRQISLAQQKNMLDGLALDACASVLIDEFADEFIKHEIIPGLHEGEFLTSRFSRNGRYLSNFKRTKTNWPERYECTNDDAGKIYYSDYGLVH